MKGLVLDTHTVVWYLMGSQQLSIHASEAIQKVNAENGLLYISVISVLEVVYLVEKQRLPNIALDLPMESLLDENSELVPAPFDFEVVSAAIHISRHAVPDMPDRIITATAVKMNLPLVTRDAVIQRAGIETIW